MPWAMCRDSWRTHKKITGLRSSAFCAIYKAPERNKPSDKIDFRGYSDADWAGDLADRKSTSGYTFMLFGAPVSWGSKKQPIVSLSTSETEYIALSLAIQEGKWIHRLLCEI